MGDHDSVIVEHVMRERARQEILLDLCNAIHMKPESKENAQPQQIIINNVSTAQTRVDDSNRGKGKQNGPMHAWSEFAREFFASGFNRTCFFGATGVGLYLIYGFLQHRWHMEAMQKKIDANFLLKASQWIFDEKGAKTAARLF